MRPLRLLLSLSTGLLAITLLVYVAWISPQDGDSESASVSSRKASFNALFSFTSPGSLFPPSAIISLTDDNSTFFLARPAAFGPDLPNDGLSGPLWIGSGFGDNNMGTGELGCGDIPEWNDGNDDPPDVSFLFKHDRRKFKETMQPKDTPLVRSISLGEDAGPVEQTSPNDGTDDHLRPSTRKTYKLRDHGHGDIQTLQESAEMAGKIALLKRGGCGFLAKVQWAQRRGATAVIVGDDVRGGALTRMYAKGDTSNITIPSLFTSHTTAHLLSSLTPSEQSPLRGSNSNGIKGHFDVEEGSGLPMSSKSQRRSNGPLPINNAPSFPPSLNHKEQIDLKSKDEFHDTEKGTGWARRLWSRIVFGKRGDDSPEDNQKAIKIKSPTPIHSFERFAVEKENGWNLYSTSHPSAIGGSSKTLNPTRDTVKTVKNTFSGNEAYSHAVGGTTRQKWWWNRRSVVNEDSLLATGPKKVEAGSGTSVSSAYPNVVETLPQKPISHEGLWVTLTPTNVSTSPFLDTLLVLVVSPLVTLTVVYALLLVRSRIRRRRWRAPKSVVERLPVRTYQTISDSVSSATPNASSPATPLLQHSPSHSVSSLPSQHSRPGSELPVTASSAEDTSRDREEEKRESGLAAWRRRYCGRQKECVVCLEEYEDGVSRVMSLPCGHEFHADCITPWLVTRRRTCPICKGDVVRSLSQSYQDRTQSTSPTRFSRFSHGEDSVQAQAAETRNDSPSASRPVPSSMPTPALGDDVEAVWSDREARHYGEGMSESRPSEVSTSLRELSSSVTTIVWRGVEAVRSTTGLQRRPLPDHVDRNR